MAEILKTLPSNTFSKAEFWWKTNNFGVKFGVDVNDSDGSPIMQYVADREIVFFGTPVASIPISQLPPLEASAVGQPEESEHRMQGKLYYPDIPNPIPNGPAAATVPPKSDDSLLYVVFQTGEPGDKAAKNTIAIFEGERYPDIFTLKSGVGDWVVKTK
ncbi:hypothetical protein RSOLAG22IIIB_13826 [Rhizoctonia solani]|uniref:Uncharacterized protein n=1 Tax=Rhizoctonia solani TaxID=456999 RepID=A0A0K6FR63_9AGAM|nr:hypothetical protein RSOLAG22IIIB_13826 [Rhizoctonia solani]